MLIKFLAPVGVLGLLTTEHEPVERIIPTPLVRKRVGFFGDVGGDDLQRVQFDAVQFDAMQCGVRVVVDQVPIFFTETNTVGGF